MNRVVLVGRITKDPELRSSNNGVQFASFTIAVNRQLPNAQGERVADFINCVAFNKQAENLARFIRKGGLIGIEGKLQTRSYQAQDGSNRMATEVLCDTITFLESRSSREGQMNNYNSTNGYNGYNNSNNYNPSPSFNNQPFNASNSNNDFNPSTPQTGNTPKSTYNPVPDKPSQPEQDSFSDIDKTFDISDDDLPF